MKRLTAVAVALLLTTNAASAQTEAGLFGGIGLSTAAAALVSVVVFAGVAANNDDTNGTNGTN
jgi:hypothetical protein